MGQRRLKPNEKRVVALAPPKGERSQHKWLTKDYASRQVRIGKITYHYNPRERREKKMMTPRQEARWWRGIGFRARVVTVDERSGRLLRRK
jgi:hypothetical protein